MLTEKQQQSLFEWMRPPLDAILDSLPERIGQHQAWYDKDYPRGLAGELIEYHYGALQYLMAQFQYTADSGKPKPPPAPGDAPPLTITDVFLSYRNEFMELKVFEALHNLLDEVLDSLPSLIASDDTTPVIDSDIAAAAAEYCRQQLALLQPKFDVAVDARRRRKQQDSARFVEMDQQSHVVYSLRLVYEQMYNARAELYQAEYLLVSARRQVAWCRQHSASLQDLRQANHDLCESEQAKAQHETVYRQYKQQRDAGAKQLPAQVKAAVLGVYNHCRAAPSQYRAGKGYAAQADALAAIAAGALDNSLVHELSYCSEQLKALTTQAGRCTTQTELDRVEDALDAWNQRRVALVLREGQCYKNCLLTQQQNAYEGKYLTPLPPAPKVPTAAEFRAYAYATAARPAYDSVPPLGAGASASAAATTTTTVSPMVALSGAISGGGVVPACASASPSANTRVHGSDYRTEQLKASTTQISGCKTEAKLDRTDVGLASRASGGRHNDSLLVQQQHAYEGEYKTASAPAATMALASAIAPPVATAPPSTTDLSGFSHNSDPSAALPAASSSGSSSAGEGDDPLSASPPRGGAAQSAAAHTSVTASSTSTAATLQRVSSGRVASAVPVPSCVYFIGRNKRVNASESSAGGAAAANGLSAATPRVLIIDRPRATWARGAVGGPGAQFYQHLQSTTGASVQVMERAPHYDYITFEAFKKLDANARRFTKEVDIALVFAVGVDAALVVRGIEKNSVHKRDSSSKAAKREPLKHFEAVYACQPDRAQVGQIVLTPVNVAKTKKANALALALPAQTLSGAQGPVAQAMHAQFQRIAQHYSQSWAQRLASQPVAEPY